MVISLATPCHQGRIAARRRPLHDLSRCVASARAILFGMSGYGQFCSIAKALEVIGER
jgi:hypothetical protein